MVFEVGSPSGPDVLMGELYGRARRRTGQGHASGVPPRRLVEAVADEWGRRALVSAADSRPVPSVAHVAQTNRSIKMTTESNTKRPTHKIFQVEDRGVGRKVFWRDVGVAWTNTEQSLNLDFAVILLIGDHTIQLRPYEEKREEARADSTPTPSPGKR